MKKILCFIILLSSAFADEIPKSLSITETLEVVRDVYKKDPLTFGAFRFGIEPGEDNIALPQAHFVAELERNLVQDQGVCEYKTIKDMRINIKLLDKYISKKGAYIFRVFRNWGHIEHLTARYLSYASEGADCQKMEVMMLLKDGTLVWLDDN